MQLMLPVVSASSEAVSVRDEAIRPPARSGLRLWLMLLAAMLTLPLLGVTIAGLVRENNNARRRSEEQLVMQARALALTVDSQLATAAALARTLAHSVLLVRGDLIGFRSEMDAAAAALPGAQVNLADRHPHMMLFTLMPPSEVLPAGTPAPAAAVALARGRDTISDLFISPFAPRVVLAVTALVPAPADAAATDPGAVSVILNVDYFTPMLQAQARGLGWVAALVDRQYRTVSRSEDAERRVYVVRSPPAVEAALQRNDNGVAHFIRQDGVAAMAAFARAPTSGYVAVIGMPEAVFDKALHGSVLGVLALALPMILLGFGLALWLSRRITQAIAGLALPAHHSPKGLRFREVDHIAERLASAERWRGMLMHEMNHRVKNTLMTVQAVALQTLRGAQGDPTLFRQTFISRLAALARAQDLLTATTCHGADIEATLKAGMAPWLEASGNAVRLAVSQDFQINAHQTQALMLALHELGTNAAKYGALSCASGSVAVDCALGPDGVAVLNWQEMGGPEVSPQPSRRGFGSRLLEVLLPQDLGPGASVQRDSDPAGLRVCIRFRPVAPANLLLVGSRPTAPTLRTDVGKWL
jgi:two-component sensor histidine kinase